MPGGCVLSQNPLNPVFQVISQIVPFSHLDKKNDADITFPALTDNQTVLNLVHAFHEPVDFGGSDPYPAGIECGI